MKRSAIASSSAVLTPARILLSSNSSVATWMAPDSAIFSISSGLFLMIMAQARLLAIATGHAHAARTPPAQYGAAARRSEGARVDSLQLFLESQRGEHRADAVVHLVGAS